MKKISAIKTSKNMNEKSRSINQEFNFDKVRKITKTPDISNNNRKEVRESIYHLLPNSELSFQQPDNLRKFFRNKEEYNNYLFYEQFLTSQRKYNRMIPELLEINKKINDNNEKIEILNANLKKMKKEKNQKQKDIVDLLSNKESLEEIYKSKMSSLLRNSQILGLQFINGKKGGPDERNNNNTDYLDCNPCSSIALFKENNYEVNTDEIKLSDKNKFEEQVIIFTSDILQKNNDDEINDKLKEKIRKAYEIFNLEVCSPTDIEPDTVINNFFTRISLFISNQSMGNYSEPFINSFLKHLLKINYTGVEISETIKFLNKTYQENKNELKEKITNLIKKNENLKNKKFSYKKQLNELKVFLDENREEFTAIKNMINENENSHYISFISSDNNIKKKRSIKKDSCKTTRMITDENLNTLKRNKISKLKEDFFNKNVQEENENINKLNVNDKENCQNKDLVPKIKHIKYKSVNNNNDLLKGNNHDETNENKSNNIKNKVGKKKINIINTTWDNGDDFNKNNYSKEYINVSSITNVDNINMNNNNIVRSFNNYVTNPIPNKNNKNNAKKLVNQKSNNTINVNNLLINNNIKIENNNNIINNNKIIKMNLNGNKSNPKIKIYNTNTNNFKLKSKKNTSCHNKTIKIKKRINIISGTPSKIDNRNDNIGNIDNVNKTEIKTNDDENIKFLVNKKVGEQNNSKDKIISLKDNRSNSHKNTNNEIKTNIIYSPSQGNNRSKNIIYLKKDRNKNELLNSENVIKNSVNNGIFKISKSPKLYKQIPNRYNIHDNNNIINNINSTNKNINKFYNQLSPKNKISVTQKCLSNNSYINKSQDISNDISGERNDSLYSKRYDNRLWILTKDINESFCYIRLSDKNSMVFDPLDNCCTITPEICNYFEGHIMIDIGFHKLKIIPKNAKDKHIDSMQILDELNDDEDEEGEEDDERKKRKCIGIELKEIADIQISDKMKNIIKIYSTYIKYGRGNENLNINKFIYMREINYIPMEHDDRIKSCFCNFFMFSLVFDNKETPKIDFIFINYDEFNLWFNCFEYIIKNNTQYKKKASNSIGSPLKKNNN